MAKHIKAAPAGDGECLRYCLANTPPERRVLGIYIPQGTKLRLPFNQVSLARRRARLAEAGLEDTAKYFYRSNADE